MRGLKSLLNPREDLMPRLSSHTLGRLIDCCILGQEITIASENKSINPTCKPKQSTTPDYVSKSFSVRPPKKKEFNSASRRCESTSSHANTMQHNTSQCTIRGGVQVAERLLGHTCPLMPPLNQSPRRGHASPRRCSRSSSSKHDGWF